MLPSLARSGSRPCFTRALFEVTSGGVFWIVAFGPLRCATRILALGSMSNLLVIYATLRWMLLHEFVGEEIAVRAELLARLHESGLDVDAIGIADRRFDDDG